MNPSVMPRQKPWHRPLSWWLRHPALILSWDGPRVTLRVGNRERTINTHHHPSIIQLIRSTT